jgi:hypothetical protein
VIIALEGNAITEKLIEWMTFVLIFSAAFYVKWMIIFVMAVIITALTVK